MVLLPFLFVRRAGAIFVMTALTCPLGVNLAEAKPKVFESVTKETLEFDGLKAVITRDSKSPEVLKGLVASTSPNYPGDFDREKWIRVLPPVYQRILVRKNRVFVSQEGAWDGPLTEVVLKRKGNKFSIEKQIPTPYHDMYLAGGKLLIGKRYVGPAPQRPINISGSTSSSHISNYSPQRTFSCDIFDDNGAVMGTIANVRHDITVWNDSLLLVPIRDENSNYLHAITDLTGNLVVPLLPNLTILKTFSGEDKSRKLMAVRLDEEGKRWLPLRADGTPPLETVPVTAYHSPNDYLLRADKSVDYWLKEYETKNGPAFGWAAPDLSLETGPKWKSIGWMKHAFPLTGKHKGYVLDHNLFVGQLLDGTWMSYKKPAVELAPGEQMVVFEPEIDTSQPTQQALFQALTPKYTAEGDNKMVAQENAVIAYAKWRERVKQQSGYTGEGDIDSEGYKTYKKLRDEYDEAVATDSHERAFNAARQLGGDLFIKHQVMVSRRKIYDIEAERFFSMAASAKDPAVAALARTRYQELLGERREAARAAKLAADKARNTPLPSNPTAWPSPNLNAYSTFEPTGLSRRQTIDNYLRDYRTWLNGASTYKPTSPF